MQKALDFAFYSCSILGQQAAEDVGKVFVDLRKVNSPPRSSGFMDPNKNLGVLVLPAGIVCAIADSRSLDQKIWNINTCTLSPLSFPFMILFLVNES